MLARSEWHDNNIQEGLMLDINNHVIEGTMTNLFLVKNKVLYTSALNVCGVSGIIRQIIIELAARQGINFIETMLSKEDIQTADELFVTNSIIGIWPIKTLENYTYSIGPFSLNFITWLNQYKQRELRA